MRAYIEAIIRNEHVSKTAEILKFRIMRKTGQQIYATSVVDHVLRNDGNGAYGIFMMLADGNHAFRLNWATSNTSAEIVGIDFWVRATEHPQYSVNTKDMNIVQIVDMIDDMMLSAHMDKEEEIGESAITEASSRSFKDVKQFFESKGYTIEKDPAFTVRRWIVTSEAGRETPIRFIPTVDQMYEELTNLGVEEFIAKYNAAAGPATVRLVGSITPAPIKTSPFDAMFEDPLTEEEIFGLLDKGISDVKSGKSKTLIITGDPGIGKTFTVTKQLAGTNTEAFKGGITSAAALYKLLFINNQAGKILIFDDLDTLFDDKESVNILKGALDTSVDTEVSYISNNTIHPLYYKALSGEVDIEDPDVIRALNDLKIDVQNMNEKRLDVMKMRVMDPYSAAAILPNKFIFVSKVIFISNRYLDELPGAILSRGGTKIEINLTLEEIVKRIGRLLDKIEIPVEPGTPPIGMKEKKAAYEYCLNVLVPYGKIAKIDFRTFFDICRLASGDTPKALWQRWASVMMREAYGTWGGGAVKRKKR